MHTAESSITNVPHGEFANTSAEIHAGALLRQQQRKYQAYRQDRNTDQSFNVFLRRKRIAAMLKTQTFVTVISHDYDSVGSVACALMPQWL